MTELNLKGDGKDAIKVNVKDGISFAGTVTSVQCYGEKFKIVGKLKGKVKEVKEDVVDAIGQKDVCGSGDDNNSCEPE